MAWWARGQNPIDDAEACRSRVATPTAGDSVQLRHDHPEHPSYDRINDDGALRVLPVNEPGQWVDLQVDEC